jgi:hypothetical protein
MRVRLRVWLRMRAVLRVRLCQRAGREALKLGRGADVFDAVPGDDGYSPLRNVHLVTWQTGRQPRELRSVDEPGEAGAAGDVRVARAGTVVNMPILEWPGAHR